MRLLAALTLAAAAAFAPTTASAANCWQDKAAYEAKWRSKFNTWDHCARAYWFIRSAPHLKLVAASCSWEGARAWHMQQIDAKVAWLVQQSKTNKCKARY